MAEQNTTVKDPDFISFLFSSKLKHDCFFVVGNENQVKPERIGVVKAMLMAHSAVLRLELEDSDLAEKDDVPLPDTSPHIFRILLRYVYGLDTTAALCFDDADNLLYVAEKYMMGSLKNKLATRLMSLLNTENICSLLNNPACYTELELSNAITKILRYETDRVLASPVFLDLSPSGFVKILEQDGLSVPEIELWRAVMKWAKHNANSEDGKDLRNQVSSLTGHIRICTLDGGELCQEVAPTDVLTSDELALVCKSIGKKEKQSGLSEFCNEIEPRVLLQKGKEVRRSEKVKFELQCTDTVCYGRECRFTLETKQYDIELLPLYFQNRDENRYVSCTTTITRITDHQDDTWTGPQVTVRFNKRVNYGAKYEIPLTSGGHNVTLLANNKYSFKMVFSGRQRMFHTRECVQGNSHLTLTLQTQDTDDDTYDDTYDDTDDNVTWYCLPMCCLEYNVADT